MLAIVSDTHSTGGHRLSGATLTAVREAEAVIHAGDFHRESAVEAFAEEAGTLRAVHGNNADAALRDRLPETRTVEYAGVRFAVVHTLRGGRTALRLFGRERDADAVVFGHTHRPTVEEAGGVTLVNPGSHTQPRGNRTAHAELETVDEEGDETGLRGRLVTPGGETFERFRIDPSAGDECE
ncbi:metallophosphoesterase [Halopenitus salinus]|uniref:Phosphoesterase n=1 Tax=Halopenitus salinus TaxID=1198295 RepID=A0ABD5UVT6_9EURY